ncbi:MAG: hypothetical protein IPI67_22940 [Myxococcales bacterium]|nr:hypothetical protein [Myxococcales bacterium]
MTLLFALIPSLVALAIFVGTFRLSPPPAAARTRPHTTLAARAITAVRTPLPVGAVRRSPLGDQLRA